MSLDASPTSADVLDTAEIAGVRVLWIRERGAGDAGHHVEVKPLDDDSRERIGPLSRVEAGLVFGAMRSTLLAAARQQAARLRSIMVRRAGAPR